MGKEKRQYYESAENLNPEKTRNHASCTGSEKIEKEAQKRIRNIYLVENTVLNYTASYRTYYTKGKEIYTHHYSYERDTSEDFLPYRILFYEPYRNGHKSRPEHVCK